ncbi:hypothetical protein WJX75_005047 [Coccomyxa subellipsoidea]|uniref:Uncharacterized protein n=1 Tax=Coccomyxa subellipsoidea TaxID=248742 RepID=A0ABR2Z1F6_9CHLO
MASLQEQQRTSQDLATTKVNTPEQAPKGIRRSSSQLAAARSVLQEALLQAAASVRERRMSSVRLQRQGELARDHRAGDTPTQLAHTCHSPRG